MQHRYYFTFSNNLALLHCLAEFLYQQLHSVVVYEVVYVAVSPPECSVSTTFIRKMHSPPILIQLLHSSLNYHLSEILLQFLVYILCCHGYGRHKKWLRIKMGMVCMVCTIYEPKKVQIRPQSHEIFFSPSKTITGMRVLQGSCFFQVLVVDTLK